MTIHMCPLLRGTHVKRVIAKPTSSKFGCVIDSDLRNFRKSSKVIPTLTSVGMTCA